MPQKNLNYQITGNSGSFERASDRTVTSMSKMERESRRLEAQQRKTHQAMETVGRGMLLAGAAVAAGLALSVRAAIEWESAWAGVLKTVDGSPEQMAALEEEIRGLTAVLPATHTEIAAVAEAAGQLGVQRENIAAFTRTMIDMGEATNLTSDEAATALARLMNIMQTAPENVDRLASAIVDLGNKGATTEAEITEMALRIAGAGSTIGLNEQQVLGFAAALSNVGIAAEAGGSSISRVFLDIDRAVTEGGDKLDTFARTAGMTADEFVAAYERDAGGAIASFIAGLGRVQQSGGDVNAILSELGLTEIRVSDALRRLAGSGDNLASSLSTGNAAWQENTALVEEAERRYGTTAAQLSIARNQVNDFAISLGTTLLPVLGEAAGTLGAMADVIGHLPGPVKTALGVVATLSAVLLLVGGAALIAVPRIAAMKVALDQLAAGAGRTAVAARGAQAALSFLGGPWGLAIAAAVTVATVAFGSWASAQAQANQRAQEIIDTLDQQNGAITENTRVWVANELEQRGVLESAERMGIDLATLTDAVLGEGDALRQVQDQLNAYAGSTEDTAIVVQDGNQQTEISRRVLEELGIEIEGAQEKQRRLQEATGGVTEEMEELDPATRDLAAAFDVSATSAEDVAGAVDDLDEELKQLFERVFGLQNAQDDLADAFDNLREKIQEQRDAGVEGAGSLDGMSGAARDLRDSAQEVLEKLGQVVVETIRTTGSADEARGVLGDFEGAMRDLAEETGVNIEELEGYNEVVAEIERQIDVLFRTPGVTAAERNAEQLRRSLDNIDRFINIHFNVSSNRPVGGLNVPEFQEGGEVPGGGSAAVFARVHPKEIVINPRVAQENRAALLALNTTGRWPVTVGGGPGGGAATGNGPARSLDGVMLHADIYLDGQKIDGGVAKSVRRLGRTNAAFRSDIKAMAG